MRVTVVNFCSTAVDMLKFSSEQLIEHAGTSDFDYLLVTMNPDKWVKEYVEATHLGNEMNLSVTVGDPVPLQFYSSTGRGCPDFAVMNYHARYEPNPKLAFVPNLRAMFNFGWTVGHELNDYVCIVNTDMAFGEDWLVNLMKRATEDVIPNSLVISPARGPHLIQRNFGRPAHGSFDMAGWVEAHDDVREEGCIQTAEFRGGWQNCALLPYVIHRKWWDLCGPWEVNHRIGQAPPDRQFFGRCVEAGAELIVCHDSVCYHHEAAERRGPRPPGLEKMREGL